MKYDAVVESTPEGWGGTVAGLPVLGLGDTIEETLRDLADTAALYVEAMTEYNQPITPARAVRNAFEEGGRIIPKAIEVEIPALTT